MNARTLASVGLIALIGTGTAAAEEHKCARCTQDRSHAAALESAAPAYQVAYEGLTAGVIHSVMAHPGMDVELMIGVGEKTFNVLVAPASWLDAMQAVFRPGERVEIVGARLDGGPGNTIIAREIYMTGQTIVVRDTEGRPLWN